MRVLITGGAGFICSNLVELLLDEGHSVRIIDHLSLELDRHDLRSVFRLELLTAYCLVRHPKQRQVEMSHCRSGPVGATPLATAKYLRLVLEVIRGPLRDFGLRAIRRVRRCKGAIVRCSNVPDIGAVVEELREVLMANGLRLADVFTDVDSAHSMGSPSDAR